MRFERFHNQLKIDVVERKSALTIVRVSNQRLALVGFEILGEPVHHAIDDLIHSVLLDDPAFISPPFFVFVPGEPTYGVIPISLKNVTAVQCPVVVHQQNVTGLHGKGGDVLFGCSLDLLAILEAEVREAYPKAQWTKVPQLQPQPQPSTEDIKQNIKQAIAQQGHRLFLQCKGHGWYSGRQREMRRLQYVTI